MKHSFLPILAVAIMAAGACGNNKNDAAERATLLLEQASTAIDADNLEQARMLLDSLDSAYTDQVDIRRQAMPLRARIMEGMSVKGIPEADELIAQCMMQIDKLGEKMAAGPDPADPFVVPSAWPHRGDILSEGIEPRVDKNGFFRLVVKSTGKNIGLNSICISNAGGEVSTAPLAADRVARLEGVELMSLSEEEFAPVAEWLKANAGAVPKLEIVGDKGRRSVKLTEAQVQMLIDAWKYSRACQQLVEARKERERLERQLKIARDQSARMHQ